jgi:hypothetical protein
MMLFSVARDYLLLALWGWPGFLLTLVVGAHLAERAFLKTEVVPRRQKLLVAAAVLAVGLFSAWRSQSLPANSTELTEQLRERERQSGDRERELQERQALQRRAKRLRSDLAGQRGR